MTPLLFASASPYKIELLNRLRHPFSTINADIDESPLPKETPQSLSLRLAITKAKTVGIAHPDLWVLGADQTADLHQCLIGKPLTHQTAIDQLSRQSGEIVRFHSAIALYHHSENKLLHHIESVDVHFRALSQKEIEHYLVRETPYDCAGSFKCEGLGITLFEKIDSQDPTALIGLPLIAVCRLLRQVGLMAA